MGLGLTGLGIGRHPQLQHETSREPRPSNRRLSDSDTDRGRDKQDPAASIDESLLYEYVIAGEQ